MCVIYDKPSPLSENKGQETRAYCWFMSSDTLLENPTLWIWQRPLWALKGGTLCLYTSHLLLSRYSDSLSKYEEIKSCFYWSYQLWRCIFSITLLETACLQNLPWSVNPQDDLTFMTDTGTKEKNRNKIRLSCCIVIIAWHFQIPNAIYYL